jgi:hypothetical protein
MYIDHLNMLYTYVDLQVLGTGDTDGEGSDDNGEAKDLTNQDQATTPNVSSVRQPPDNMTARKSTGGVLRRDGRGRRVGPSKRITRSVSHARTESEEEVDELESDPDARAMPPPAAIANLHARGARMSATKRPAPGQSIKKKPKKTKRRSTGGISRTLDLDSLTPSSPEIVSMSGGGSSSRARAMTIEMVDAMAKLRIEDEVSTYIIRASYD